MRAPLIAVATAVLAAAPAAAASTGHEQDVADALGSAPVYVAPARADVLDAGAVGRLQLLIVKKDIGRIKVAVIPRSWAQQSGGVGRFTSGVDSEIDLRGTLVVVAEDAKHYDVHATTSHTHVDEVVAGVQHGFDGGGSLEQRLARSIRALAEADPGASGDTGTEDNTPANTPTINLPDPNKIVDTVKDTIRWTVFLIIAAVLAPFLFVGFRLWAGARRRRREDEEVREDDLAAANAERDALGQDIVDLDVATSMPNVPAPARAAYERALDAYEKSELALKQADSTRRLNAAKQLIANGRRDAATARAGTASQSPT